MIVRWEKATISDRGLIAGDGPPVVPANGNRSARSFAQWRADRAIGGQRGEPFVGVV
jgi:hypothetical protein